MSIQLTPDARLRWNTGSSDETGAMQSAFDADWRAALFSLAAERNRTGQEPATWFWQQIAERFSRSFVTFPKSCTTSAPRLRRLANA